ncbi:MAG: hypothetical protein ABH828_02970 [archaeon]
MMIKINELYKKLPFKGTIGAVATAITLSGCIEQPEEYWNRPSRQTTFYGTIMERHDSEEIELLYNFYNNTFTGYNPKFEEELTNKQREGRALSEPEIKALRKLQKEIRTYKSIRDSVINAQYNSAM